jgi:hypothetical protein
MPTITTTTGSTIQTTTTPPVSFRNTVEATLTKVVPCHQQWGFFSAPTFALGGLAIAWLTGRSKLYGAGIGGLIGFLISWYGRETPFTKASEVSPALVAAAIAEFNVRSAAVAAERDATNAQWIAQGRTPMVSLSPVYRGSADNALVGYCRGPYEYDVTAGGRNVSQHTQECSAGGWRDTVPAFRCFRAPSFQY